MNVIFIGFGLGFIILGSLVIGIALAEMTKKNSTELVLTDDPKILFEDENIEQTEKIIKDKTDTVEENINRETCELTKNEEIIWENPKKTIDNDKVIDNNNIVDNDTVFTIDESNKDKDSNNDINSTNNVESNNDISNEPSITDVTTNNESSTDNIKDDQNNTGIKSKRFTFELEKEEKIESRFTPYSENVEEII